MTRIELMTRIFITLLSISLLAACTQVTPTLSFPYDETTQGDLSGDRTKPTVLSLTTGSNTLSGTTVGGDLDYISITIPEGQVMTELILKTYDSVDSQAFIALQEGKTFTEPNENPSEANLLGWALFGPAELTQNLLPIMAAKENTQGFSTPLQAKSYSFWIQQTGLTTEYSFDFVLESAE